MTTVKKPLKGEKEKQAPTTTTTNAAVEQEVRNTESSFRIECDAAQARPCIRPLRNRLLRLGGQGVTILPEMQADEPFVKDLLFFGRVSDGEHVTLHQMQSGAGHRNSALLAMWHPERFQRETGYALCCDGNWRAHSWAWDMLSNNIVETTGERTLYYGVLWPLSSYEVIHADLSSERAETYRGLMTSTEASD